MRDGNHATAHSTRPSGAVVHRDRAGGDLPQGGVVGEARQGVGALRDQQKAVADAVIGTPRSSGPLWIRRRSPARAVEVHSTSSGWIARAVGGMLHGSSRGFVSDGLLMNFPVL